MWLVLCSSSDSAALWAYEGLKERGLVPIELVFAEELVYARWQQRLGINGVFFQMTLRDGRSICNENVFGVLNRISHIPWESLMLIDESDREYVIQELTAFYLSWLHCMRKPQLNRPTPRGLSGQCRHLSEWVWLASRAGLPTLEYKEYSHHIAYCTSFNESVFPPGTPIKTVIVVDGHVCGASAPINIQNGCRRLAELSKTDLLGVGFSVSPEDAWTFASATTAPDLRLGEHVLLDILASVLGRGRERIE